VVDKPQPDNEYENIKENIDFIDPDSMTKNDNSVVVYR